MYPGVFRQKSQNEEYGNQANPEKYKKNQEMKAVSDQGHVNENHRDGSDDDVEGSAEGRTEIVQCDAKQLQSLVQFQVIPIPAPFFPAKNQSSDVS